MCELKAMVWNIHGAASTGWNNNYTIKKFVVDKITSINASIIIINEFVIASGWDYFQDRLINNDYLFFLTHTSTNNGVLIAVKKYISGLNFNNQELYGAEIVSTYMNTTINDKPNFLQVKLSVNNKELYIIGIRIKVLIEKDATETQKQYYKNQQLRALKDHLDSISSDAMILCGGDFNTWRNPISNMLSSNYNVSTPKYQMAIWQDYSTLNTWSAVPYKNGNKQLFDHFISSKNIQVIDLVYDGWSFVFSNPNEYKNRKAEDYKSDLIGCPDHDILHANICLNTI